MNEKRLFKRKKLFFEKLNDMKHAKLTEGIGDVVKYWDLFIKERMHQISDIEVIKRQLKNLKKEIKILEDRANELLMEKQQTEALLKRKTIIFLIKELKRYYRKLKRRFEQILFGNLEFIFKRVSVAGIKKKKKKEDQEKVKSNKPKKVNKDKKKKKKEE